MILGLGEGGLGYWGIRGLRIVGNGGLGIEE